MSKTLLTRVMRALGFVAATTQVGGQASAPAYNEIIAAIDPWMLSCAVGAMNGSIGTSMGFDMWFDIASKNFLPKVTTKTGANASAVETALRQYAVRHQHLNWRTVLRQVERERGLPAAGVLGPDESAQISVTITNANERQ